MAFTLHMPSSSEQFTHADDRFFFNKANMLVVSEAGGRQRIFAPSAWLYVEHEVSSSSYEIEGSVV